MANLVVKNISSQPLWFRDFYTTIAPGQTAQVNRTPAELGDMRGLQTFIDQGMVEVTVLLDPYEISSELVAVWPLGLNWRPVAASTVALNALPVAKNRLGDLRLVTGSLTLYVWDGAGWVGLGGGGGAPPLAHASTHFTGGTDPIAVGTGNAAVSITDPGHVHTVNPATALNNTVTLSGWYAINSVEQPWPTGSAARGTIAQNAATALPTGQPGVPRLMVVDFPVGWLGGSVTINGTGRGGLAMSETFAFPLGGGVVVGVKAFMTLTNYVNSAPAGGAGVLATVALGDGYGVPHDDIVAFLKVSIDGAADSFALTDTANGVFEPVGAHHGNHAVDVWYTYLHNTSQSSHTHTLNSGATGITGSDTGHTHALV